MSQSVNDVWGSQTATEVIELPSGQTACVLKELSPWSLIEAGLGDDDVVSSPAEYMKYMGKILAKIYVVEPSLAASKDEAEDGDRLISAIPKADIEELVQLVAKQLSVEEVDAEANTFPDEPGSDGGSEDGSILGDDSSSGTGTKAGKPKSSTSKPRASRKAKPKSGGGE